MRVAFNVIYFVLRHGSWAVAALFVRAVAVAPLLAPVYAAIAAWLIAMLVGLPGWACVLLPVAVLAGMVAALGDEGRRFSLGQLEAALRERAIASRERLLAVRVRRRWAETCLALGWDKVDGDPVRRPELRHVDVRGHALRLSWRPRGDQKAAAWPALVDALRRRLGAFSADFREDPKDPGAIVASFGLVPVPDRVDANGGGRLAARDPYTPEVGQLGRKVSGDDADNLGAFALGPRAGGGAAAWAPAEVPHLLVAGATGGGKGGLLRLLAHRTHAAGWAVRVLDPKGSGEQRWAHEAGIPVLHDLEGQVDLLRATAQEVLERCRLTWAHGVDRVGALPEALRPAPVLVILDEAPDVLLLRRVLAEKAADELRSEAASLVSEIAAKGRAAAVHLVLSVQRPTVDVLGQLGGFLRANLAGRVLLGRANSESLEAMFGPGHGDLAPQLSGIPGRALVAGLRAGEVEPALCQVAWLDAADLLPEGFAPDEVGALNGAAA
jgi:hypothetical protein